MNISVPYIQLIVLAVIAGTLMSCNPKQRKLITESPTEMNRVSTTRYEIVEQARNTVGAGYKYGATGSSKFDCSGLVYSLFLAQDIALPRSTDAMSSYGEEIKLHEVKPGDLIFFRNVRKIDHVAIVSRKSPTRTWLIHSTTSRGVVEEVLEESHYWKTRVDQCRRIIPLAESEGTAFVK